MLLIFTDLLIIGKLLDLGGSDSDTSHSTIAKPSTSGTVGDSPHARTLSASNLKQSRLEEFSVSTDSGTYSQWFFSETGLILTSC